MDTVEPTTDRAQTTRWETYSHGEEAERLRQAREATELARLASSTALLLDIVASEGVVSDELAGLVSSAENLTRMLELITAGKQIDERKLPYHQLVPLKVWQSATRHDEELLSLAERAPQTIIKLLAGKVEKPMIDALIPQLQTLARCMHERGDELLAR